MIFRSDFRMVVNKLNAAPLLLLLILTRTEIGILLKKAESCEFVALGNTEPRKDTEVQKSSILPRSLNLINQ